MAHNNTNTSVARLKRKARVRKKISGTPQRPRLSVFRSLKHMHVQAIDDTAGLCLAAASTLDKQLRSQVQGTDKTKAAQLVGDLLAKRLQAKDISHVVFDRNGFRYTGRVAALAAGVRHGGIQV